jgi:hypothetical protein
VTTFYRLRVLVVRRGAITCRRRTIMIEVPGPTRSESNRVVDVARVPRYRVDPGEHERTCKEVTSDNGASGAPRRRRRASASP